LDLKKEIIYMARWLGVFASVRFFTNVAMATSTQT